MNMFLHGIGDENARELPIHVVDSLRTKPGENFDMVLTNPVLAIWDIYSESKPLLLGTVMDPARGKSELIAENTLLRQ